MANKHFLNRKHLIKALGIAIVVLTATAIASQTAFAYSLTGQKWDSKSLKINPEDSIQGDSMTGFKAALSDYSANTKVSLATTATTTVGWTAFAGKFGNTGWDARTDWSYNSSTNITYKSLMRMNISSTSSFNSSKLKVIWEHEIGHALGLDHVSGTNRVMYKSAATAWNNGVKKLTSDEINGIKALY